MQDLASASPGANPSSKMDPEGQPTAVVVRRRRRRTRRHRRNRSLRRAALLAAIAGTLLGFWVSLIPGDFIAYVGSFWPAHTSTIRQQATRAQFLPPTPELPPPASQHEVYPYSVIPGGVHSVKELRDVFEHDPVLAAHYRGFDFQRARLVRLTQDRTVYVSYRIAGKIYWTTKRVSVRAGEILITDGVITIRTRCGNQVSAAPRQEVAPSQEPNVALLDRPMRFGDPPSVVPPVPNLFESSLQRPSFPVYVGPTPNFLLAAGPSMGMLFAPNPGVCNPFPPNRKPVYGGPAPGGGSNKHKRKGNPCDTGGTPGETPEPSSILLVATGMAGIYFCYRRQRRSLALAQNSRSLAL